MRSALPPSLPLPTALQTYYWIRQPTQFMEQWSRHYGHAYRLRLIQRAFNLFSDPDSIRAIFAAKQDEMHAGKVNRLLRTVVGDSSVLLLDGPEHMRHRKLLMPSFHGERMRLYGEAMAEITRQTLATFPADETFAIQPFMQEITLQVILRTVFGADEGAELDDLSQQIRRLLSVGDHRAAFLIMIYLASRPEAEQRFPWRALLRERERTDRLLYRIIAARRGEPDAVQRKDVLAMLMQARDEAGEPLTDHELRDELMTALVAGHETSATALAWAFERILSHPQVLGRLREELRAAGGTAARPEQLAALPYLDATLKEVLRQRPIVAVVGRVLQQPAVIGGYELPAGEAVGACIYLSQRNPDIYPDPERFYPERFLNVPVDPLHWLPFGGGIRRCIGAQFAMYELKIVLGTLLAHCDLSLAQRTPIRTVRRAVTFAPEHGTLVRLRNRASSVH